MITEPCAPGDLLCQEAVELVTDYLDGVLDEEAVARLEQHLSMCESCRTYFDQIRLVVSGLSTLSPTSLTTRTRQEIIDTFRQVRARP